MGIGEIPDAVLIFLEDKKHLGVHTEMFSDGLVELFEAGVVTNERKTLHRGKIVASFVIGTRKAFDFVDNNPFMEFHPNEYVNDPFIIAQNDNMVAINSALSVDLTGQVCADSIGTSIYSGFGGQLDFIRGAARVQGRGADHRPAVDRQRAARSRASSTPCCPAPGSSPPAPTSTTWSPSTAIANLLRQEPAGAGAAADRHRPPGLPRRARARRRSEELDVMGDQETGDRRQVTGDRC